MTSNLHYTGLALDRADHLRRDENEINRLWGCEQTRVIPLCNLKNLVNATATESICKTQAQLHAADIVHTEYSFLGIDGECAVFAVDCNEQQAGRWLALDKDSQFLDLRTVGPTLPRSQAPTLAYARGLFHWQQHNKFCALCGSQNKLQNGGHMMCCTSDACNKQVFPRTDPAVIMLIERVSASGERLCLLGRSPAWPLQVYSTLAGFVETGETLEEAVAREVFEEAGVVVENVRYVASQPWPFPQSIMLGFIATATTEEITIDPVELAEARWFSDTEIAEFGNWGDESDGPKLPRPDSIARYLIESWRNKTWLM